MARVKNSVSANSVVVVGSYVQDHAWTTEQFPVVGESRIGTFSTGPGGKGFNQAIACHRQGIATRFIGAVGADHLAHIANNFAHTEKLACAWEVHPDQFTAASTITINARGENLIVVALGANAALSVDFVRTQCASFTNTHVLLAQLECNLGATREALSLARAAGVLTILNPAPINAALSHELLTLADILTPNETEFAFLMQHLFQVRLAENYWANDTSPDVDAALHRFCRQTGVATVIITLGDKGCFVSHANNATRGDDKAYYRLIAEQVNTVDTTGAGDAFSGGLAAGLIHFHNQPFQRAVQHANHVAALSTEILGTAPAMPTLAQVQARFPHR